ncbi:MAG: class I SAM-dependent methyltransferase, partial [Bacteroidota bacterium]
GEHANEKYGSENCHYLPYGGSKMPFDDNSFDAVISFQVIEHIVEDRNYLSEIHRVLKTGGTLIITTPNRTNRLKPGQKPFNPFHVREYAPGEFEEVLKSSFKEAKVLGIRGNEGVQKIELDRVKLGSGLISFDRFNLRKLIPSSVKRQIIWLLKALRNKGSEQQGDLDFMTRYRVEDFFVMEEHVEESLDLLAILKK